MNQEKHFRFGVNYSSEWLLQKPSRLSPLGTNGEVPGKKTQWQPSFYISIYHNSLNFQTSNPWNNEVTKISVYLLFLKCPHTIH